MASPDKRGLSTQGVEQVQEPKKEVKDQGVPELVAEILESAAGMQREYAMGGLAAVEDAEDEGKFQELLRLAADVGRAINAVFKEGKRLGYVVRCTRQGAITVVPV